jgi:hypothetical protein
MPIFESVINQKSLISQACLYAVVSIFVNRFAERCLVDDAPYRGGPARHLD